MRNERNIEKARRLFTRADKQWNGGNLRSAFRLMLAAAKMGDSGAQVNVGYMYDCGIGTRPRQKSALYWYKRAYRRGDACAASNIGTVWRDKKDFKRALYWFQRAITLSRGDDGDAELEIAKLHLNNERALRKAVVSLKKVTRSKNVTQAGVEEAERLLKQIRRMPR
jgi:uncharacterized protein